MNSNNLHLLPLDQLQRLHESASLSLKRTLLTGAEWKDIEEKQMLLTELSIAIDKRKTESSRAESTRQAESPLP
jgi:hypothetical protein